MTKKTSNLVMAVANDNGNGWAKTYCQFEDGTGNTTITPSLYAPVSKHETIPDLEESNEVQDFNDNMDVLIKSPSLKTTSEYLVGKAAINSGNNLIDYNVEANLGKVTPDISMIMPLAKIAYAALNHILSVDKYIPTTININLAYYLTCLPISEFVNKERRKTLCKKLSKGKHTVIIKNFEHDIKVVISFSSTNTFIYPEGITAQIGLVYDPESYLTFRQGEIYANSPYKDGLEYSNTGNALLIDIGDGTTDISIMNGVHPLKGLGVNISLNQGVGTAAAAASDQLAIDYPRLGHYTRSVFLNRINKNTNEGKTLRDKYLAPQINALLTTIETEVEKEFSKTNNDINTVVILGGGVKFLNKKNRLAFQKMLNELNPFNNQQTTWWIDPGHSQLLNLDGLRIFLARKFGQNK